MASPSSITIADATHKIQLALIESTAFTERRLLAAGELLSLPDYEDVVVERSIASLCGWPLCPNPLPADRPRAGRFRIALREHRVYNLQETHKFCSPDCLIRSRAFSETLETERCADLSPSKIDLALRSFGYGELGVDLGENGDLGISNLKIREKGDGGVAEVSIDEWIGPSNSIEGYVPQHDRRQGSEFSSDTKTGQRANGHGTDEMDFSSSAAMKDVSEMIAKQLEDVIISEKKPRKKRTPSKFSKSKHKERADGNVSDIVDFTNSIMIPDHVSEVPTKTDSVPMLDYSGQLGKESEDCSHLEKKVSGKITLKGLEDNVCSEKFTNEAALKSSLRTSGSNVGNRSVKWADEIQSVDVEEKMKLESTESLQVSNEEDVNSLRFASAEACAAALLQASEAVASGASEVRDAVSGAGILILPQAQCGNEEDSEAGEDMFEFDTGFVKWPKKPVLLDTDMFDVEDSWHDTVPEGFSLTLSSFAAMWMATFEWITCSSLAYIYGHDESSADDFLLVNGREYPHKIFLRDGKSSEIRQALDGCVCRALPGLVMNLRLPTPVSTLEKAVGRLLDTMTFVDALPSLRIKQWHVIILLFIDALSVHRVPALAPYMTNRDMLIHKVLSAAQLSGDEYESMRDLMMPLGRLPQFSMQRGG